jgi:hypothetical protein
MAKTVLQVTSHQSYSYFFQNLHDGDEFATDVVTMGGSVELPVKIHNSAIVPDFSLKHAPFDVSLQCAMAIILKRSQDQTFSAPGPRGKSFFSTGFCELMDTRLGKEESAAADHMPLIGCTW